MKMAREEMMTMKTLEREVETIQSEMTKSRRMSTAKKAETIPVIMAADRTTIHLIRNREQKKVMTRIQAAMMTKIKTHLVKEMEETKAPAIRDRDTRIKAMMTKDHHPHLQEKTREVMIAI